MPDTVSFLIVMRTQRTIERGERSETSFRLFFPPVVKDKKKINLPENIRFFHEIPERRKEKGMFKSEMQSDLLNEYL